MALKNRVQKNIDMTSGSVYSLLISFAIPLLLGDLFQQLYNMTDTWVIGNFASNEEYAAVGACAHILNLVIKTFIGLSSGAGIIIARDFGRGDIEKVNRDSHTAAAIAIFCSIGFTIFALSIIPFSLKITKIPNEIYDYAKEYLTIIFSLVSAQIIYNMGAAILRSVGDSVKPFFYLVIAAFVNVILDLYFVIELKMGIKGVAWATAIAQIVAAALIVIDLFNTELCVKLSLSKIKYERLIGRSMFSLGLPTAIQMAVTSISNTFIQKYINGLGLNFVSGFSTFTKTEQILFMSANSLGVACTTFVSQNIGSGNKKRAKEGIYKCCVLSSIYCLVLCTVVVIFAPEVAAFFNKDEEVMQYGILALRLVTPFFPLQSVTLILASAVRGFGDSKSPLFIQVFFNIVYRQISMFIIYNYLTYDAKSILLVQPTSWVVFSAAMIIDYIIARKKYLSCNMNDIKVSTKN